MASKTQTRRRITPLLLLLLFTMIAATVAYAADANFRADVQAFFAGLRGRAGGGVSMSTSDSASGSASGNASSEETMTESGTVEDVDSSTITVNGQLYLMDNSTKISGDIDAGDAVTVAYVQLENGDRLAVNVRAGAGSAADGEQHSTSGTVQAISGSTITVDGQQYAWDASLNGDIQVGDQVNLSFVELDDGSRVALSVHASAK